MKLGSSQQPNDAPVYDNPVAEERQMEEKNVVLDRIILYARVITDTVNCLYDIGEGEPNVVYFGTMVATLPKRKYATSASFARNPWVSGCLAQPPPIPLVDKFYNWVSGNNDFDLDRYNVGVLFLKFTSLVRWLKQFYKSCLCLCDFMQHVD